MSSLLDNHCIFPPPSYQLLNHRADNCTDLGPLRSWSAIAVRYTPQETNPLSRSARTSHHIPVAMPLCGRQKVVQRKMVLLLVGTRPSPGGSAGLCLRFRSQGRRCLWQDVGAECFHKRVRNPRPSSRPLGCLLASVPHTPSEWN